MRQTIKIFFTSYLMLFYGCNSIPEQDKRVQDEGKIVEVALSHFFEDCTGNFYIRRVLSDSTIELDSTLLQKLQSRYSTPKLRIHSFREAELKDVRSNPEQMRDDHYIDKKTGEAGELITVGEIKWIDGNNVEVRIGRWFGLLFGSSNKYKLSRDRLLIFFDRGWKVEDANTDINF